MKVINIEHLVPITSTEKAQSHTIINLDIDELGIYPDYIEKYESLIEKKQYTTSSFTILIFPNEKIKTILNRYSKYQPTYDIELVGKVYELDDQIKKIEEQYKLISKTKHINKKSYELLTERYNYPIFCYLLSYTSKNELKKTRSIINFDQKGFIEIGMNDNFFHSYKINQNFYFHKKDIEKYSLYFSNHWIEFHSKTMQGMINYFNASFLDNFEEGKSIYYVWWN